MADWTMENTWGFTQDQLNIINDAKRALSRQLAGVDETNINDAINDAWHDGITVNDLTKAAVQQLD